MLGGNDELGAFLVDPEGRTLYVYANDEPNWSNCTGTCLNNWEVYTVEADTPLVAGAGLNGELALTERADGTHQVTYNQQPLYYFTLDRNPGDAIGNGAGNLWSVVPIAL
jgi:predicted lipoprotein with Yx(FWY)xxD motif